MRIGGARSTRASRAERAARRPAPILPVEIKGAGGGAPQAYALEYAGGVWKCPATGYVVPMEDQANLLKRIDLLEKASDNPAYQEELWSACAKSFGLWLALFGMTYRQMTIDPETGEEVATGGEGEEGDYVPFIPFPRQLAAAYRLIDCIDGLGEIGKQDAVIDKSRDMGASWLCLAVIVWMFLFRPNYNALVMSRKEEFVVGPSPKTLYWKIQCLLDHLPEWMRPALEFQQSPTITLRNMDNGGFIDGESTNNHAGRGARYKTILIDEAGAIDNLGAIRLSTDKATPCRIYNSTPVGPGEYSQLVFSGKINLIILPWWDHPEKGANRRLERDPHSKALNWQSPWRALQQVVKSPREVAQNIDIDHASAGDMFFDGRSLVFHRETFARVPMHEGELIHLIPEGPERDLAISKGGIGYLSFKAGIGRKRLKLWLDLYPDVEGLVRPAQNRHYGIGVDISHGTGNSNSVAFIIDMNTGEQVGELACANTSEQDFARLCCMLGHWFGGINDRAFLAWEGNGPGVSFGNTVMKLAYPWVLRDLQRAGSTKGGPRGDRLGWWSDRDSKQDVLGDLAGDMHTGRVIIRSNRTIDEMGSYVYYDNGGIGPGPLENVPEEGRALHGDRVIAAALANRARRRAPSIKPDERKAPRMSPAWLKQQEEKAKDEHHY